MSPPRPIRLGFIGAGQMGQMAHLRHYAAIDGCELAALAEPRPDVARAVAQRYGIARLYPGHREMIDAESLDGIVACQPFAVHADLLPELYRAARFVFSEKPLAVSASAGERLARLAADAGAVHMVGYHKRSDPATIEARRTLDRWRADGRMGRPRYVRITMPPGDWIADGLAGMIAPGRPRPPVGLTPEPPDPAMDAATHERYVAFVNYYIHQVNLMRHLLGEPYRVVHAEPAGLLMIVRSDSGVSGAIEMAPYRTTVGWEESALVAFEKGYVRLTLPAPLALGQAGTVEIYSDPGDGATPQRTFPAMPPVPAMRRQAETFLDVCRGQCPPPCDAAEAAEDLRVARDTITMESGQ